MYAERVITVVTVIIPLVHTVREQSPYLRGSNVSDWGQNPYSRASAVRVNHIKHLFVPPDTVSLLSFSRQIVKQKAHYLLKRL